MSFDEYYVKAALEASHTFFDFRWFRRDLQRAFEAGREEERNVRAAEPLDHTGSPVASGDMESESSFTDSGSSGHIRTSSIRSDTISDKDAA